MTCSQDGGIQAQLSPDDHTGPSPELIICLHDCNAKDVMPHLLMCPFSSSCYIPRLNICLQNLSVETESLFQFMLLFVTHSSFFFPLKSN